MDLESTGEVYRNLYVVKRGRLGYSSPSAAGLCRRIKERRRRRRMVEAECSSE